MSASIREFALAQRADPAVVDAQVYVGPKRVVERTQPLLPSVRLLEHGDDSSVALEAAIQDSIAMEVAMDVHQLESRATDPDRVPTIPPAKLERRKGRYFAVVDDLHGRREFDVTTSVEPILRDLVKSEEVDRNPVFGTNIPAGLHALGLTRYYHDSRDVGSQYHPRPSAHIGLAAGAPEQRNSQWTEAERVHQHEVRAQFGELADRQIGPSRQRSLVGFFTSIGADFIVSSSSAQLFGHHSSTTAGSTSPAFEVMVPYSQEYFVKKAVCKHSGVRIEFLEELNLLDPDSPPTPGQFEHFTEWGPVRVRTLKATEWFKQLADAQAEHVFGNQVLFEGPHPEDLAQTPPQRPRVRRMRVADLDPNSWGRTATPPTELPPGTPPSPTDPTSYLRPPSTDRVNPDNPEPPRMEL